MFYLSENNRTITKHNCNCKKMLPLYHCRIIAVDHLPKIYTTRFNKSSQFCSNWKMNEITSFYTFFDKFLCCGIKPSKF